MVIPYDEPQISWRMALRLQDAPENLAEGATKLGLLIDWFQQPSVRKFAGQVFPALLVFRDVVLRDLTANRHVVLIVVNGRVAQLLVDGKASSCFDIATGEIVREVPPALIIESFDLSAISQMLKAESVHAKAGSSKGNPAGS